ncbi:MAG: hypothetical protein M0C28_00260 [Candidatus Moduliflexus flocculans]|nr:hypothetical protein [Candidatus Moduliflexus flocculans]
MNKEEIVRAIAKGAETVQDISRLTGACTGIRVRDEEPSGQCCTDIQALIDLYLPALESDEILAVPADAPVAGTAEEDLPRWHRPS